MWIVPIGTHPGLAAALVGIDLPIAAFSQTSRATRFWLRRENEAGALSASLRNATGGGGDGIDLTLGTGVDSGAASGQVEGMNLYLRITAADAGSENLSGWIEVESSSAVAAALTTLARVNEWIGNANDQTFRSDLIAGASAKIRAYTGRDLVESAVVDERYDGRGREVLVLRGRPVSAVSEVRIDGVAIAASTYELDVDGGLLYRRSASDPYTPDVWPWGNRNVAVDLTRGYATIPEDLVLAATKQVAFEYAARGSRIRERGEVLDAGGSAQFLTGPWAPGVLSVLDAYRGLRFA